MNLLLFRMYKAILLQTRVLFLTMVKRCICFIIFLTLDTLAREEVYIFGLFQNQNPTERGAFDGLVYATHRVWAIVTRCVRARVRCC